MFEGYGDLMVKREVDGVLHPSCLVSTVQACGGSVMIWGYFSWSGPGSAMLHAQRFRLGDLLNRMNDQVFLSLFFFYFHDDMGISKITMPQFTSLKL